HPGAGALAVPVFSEQVERVSARVDEDPAEAGLRRLDDGAAGGVGMGRRWVEQKDHRRQRRERRGRDQPRARQRGAEAVSSSHGVLLMWVPACTDTIACSSRPSIGATEKPPFRLPGNPNSLEAAIDPSAKIDE